jgi:para-aminobenzoate synthetase/4-amino-4-deoxychorismate lyase
VNAAAGTVVLRLGDRWRTYRDPRQVVTTDRVGEVLGCLDRLEEAVRRDGRHAAGFISYEASPAFDPAFTVRRPQNVPLLWFGIYDPAQAEEAGALDPAPRAPGSVPLVLDWRATVSWEHYAEKLRAIKEKIAAGTTYQVNYTWRLRASFRGDPRRYFAELAARSGAGYAAYVDTGRWAVCSASPELFFRLERGTLTARPMKGTASRGETPGEDEERARRLASSPKDRAENVMIVDMIRSDIGRVAEIGSVSVPRLCQVERFPTVLQMTSTVSARVTAPLCDVLRALFPCASITGAPKVSTMAIIADLESTPRGVYTGSIGCVVPEPGGVSAQFNVAIRTVTVDRESETAEYGVGGGILWESDPGEEYRECEIKMRVLRT